VDLPVREAQRAGGRRGGDGDAGGDRVDAIHRRGARSVAVHVGWGDVDGDGQRRVVVAVAGRDLQAVVAGRDVVDRGGEGAQVDAGAEVVAAAAGAVGDDADDLVAGEDGRTAVAAADVGVELQRRGEDRAEGADGPLLDLVAG